MSFSGFTASDFKVFDIPGFKPRMEAIKTRIRPKLEAAGRDLLAGRLAGSGVCEAFAHVARHARRTVNPPDDTWVAFAGDKRGYKKHCHFKVAVSRGAVRFLFEAGPEHADKKRWVAAWKRHGPQLVPVLRRAKGLAWFKNEHDEKPAAVLTDLSADDVARLGEELHAHARRPARARPRRVGRGSRALEVARLRARGARDLPPPRAALPAQVTAAPPILRPSPRHHVARPARPLAFRLPRSVGYDGLTMTSACIFDMDGVLIDSGAHHRSAWRALLDELGVAPVRAGVLAAHHRPARGGGGAPAARRVG